MPNELFQPTLHAYIGYCAGYCLRYFGLAGGVYLLVFLLFRRSLGMYRIQDAFPSLRAVAHEVRWSLSNMLCTGVSTLFLYHLIQSGQTPMYYVVGERGWLYFVLSVAAGILAYDTWFYWQHRILHLPWLFRHVHRIHHRSTNPTAFGAFAHHPVETLMCNAFFIVLVKTIPLHSMAFALIGAYLFGTAIVAHLGYEFLWKGFTRHRLSRHIGTSTYHNMHHRYAGMNYGVILTCWDRLMGTLHPEYDRTFDAIKSRAVTCTRSQANVVLGRGQLPQAF